MKRVVIVHGWGGSIYHGWYRWLKAQLESKGYHVALPKLPNPNYPRLETWIPALAESVGTPDESTYFVGHSLGCQTIARYLETLPKGVKVGGAIFVAGFFDSLFRENYNKEDMATSDLWINTPIDLRKIKSHLNKSIALFSEDDPDVPIGNKDRFANELGSEVVILNGYGHFTGSDGFNKLPIVLANFLKIAS